MGVEKIHIKWRGKMSEPDYYAGNGLSPIGAFKQGLMSKEQYKGFLIGNVIKYVVRAGKKDDAIKDLEKAKTYIDFYLELMNVERVGNIPINIEVNDDIDWDKFKEDVEKALKDANKVPCIMETPTTNPHIMKLELSDVMYDETGTLKPEARDAIKEYLEERRNHG